VFDQAVLSSCKDKFESSLRNRKLSPVTIYVFLRDKKNFFFEMTFLFAEVVLTFSAAADSWPGTAGLRQLPCFFGNEIFLHLGNVFFFVRIVLSKNNDNVGAKIIKRDRT
jgi:hypothetical protein